jgi:hypothetical protein
VPSRVACAPAPQVKELRAQTQQLVEAHDKLHAHMQALQEFKNRRARKRGCERCFNMRFWCTQFSRLRL